ncbi:MAG: biopolymer transporter ExbD [Elusimicrobiota bacterium]
MEEEKLSLNLIPLCDICMSLLIVFIVSGPLIIQPSLEVNPPEATTNEEKEEQDKVTVYVSNDEQFAVDESIVKFEKIEDLLSRKLVRCKSKLVVISADKDSLHGSLLDVMSLAKKCGAKSVTIATNPKK